MIRESLAKIGTFFMSVCEKITKEYEKTFLGVIRYGDIGK